MNTTSDTSPTLLERLRDGQDALAWDEFYERYWRLIFWLAQHRGCSDHTAEEIVQEVMLAVFNRGQVFRYEPGRGRFRDWLATVVRNQVIKLRQRASERVRARGGDSNQGLGEPEADDAQPDEACETAFERALLLVLVEAVRRQVEPSTYQAFELLVLQKRSGREAARITGLRRNAVYQARKRVFERLRQLGAPYRADGSLDEQLRRAMELRTDARIDRSVTERIENTMRAAGEPNR